MLCLNYQEHANITWSHSHQEEENCFCSFLGSPPDVSFASPKPDQKDFSISPIFGRKNTHERILACTQTFIHTHTVYPSTFKQCSELWQTDSPGSKQEGFQLWPNGPALIPSISFPLGVGHGYCAQKHILKTIHNTSSCCGLISVIIAPISCY